jgi:hypothetical protein
MEPETPDDKPSPKRRSLPLRALGKLWNGVLLADGIRYEDKPYVPPAPHSFRYKLITRSLGAVLALGGTGMLGYAGYEAYERDQALRAQPDWSITVKSVKFDEGGKYSDYWIVKDTGGYTYQVDAKVAPRVGDVCKTDGHTEDIYTCSPAPPEPAKEDDFTRASSDDDLDLD